MTTTVTLEGEGATGRGEDVTYEAAAHDPFPIDVLPDPATTLGELSRSLESVDLFPDREPAQAIFRNFRRWAIESAALDLALRQAGTTLGELIEREYDPVEFVVSTRLGEPPTGAIVTEWLERDPTLSFKLDPTSEWTPETIARLAETGAVRTLDLKGAYSGTDVDQPPDPTLYRRVLEGFPDAIVEDPAVTEETRPLLEAHTDRISWDYPITGLSALESLPWEPTWINVKPSRFGSVRSLFETLGYCLENDIRLYGGGQFELDVGRDHIQGLASLFYPDAPNDVAPGGYNDPSPPETLAGSPLDPGDPVGLSVR